MTETTTGIAETTIDSSVKRITQPTGRLEMFAGGGLAAVILFSIGVFMTVVPILGWIVGPGLMIAAGVVAILHLAGMLRSKEGYTGLCPYCGVETTAGEPGSVGRCHACRKRIEHLDGKLCTMEQ